MDLEVDEALADSDSESLSDWLDNEIDFGLQENSNDRQLKRKREQ